VGGAQLFVRRSNSIAQIFGRRRRGCLRIAPEGDDPRVSHQIPDSYPLGRIGEHAAALIGDTKVSALGGLDQPSSAQIRLGPMDAVGECRLSTARQKLSSLLLRQSELFCKRLDRIRHPDLAFGGQAQQRQCNRLEVRDWHLVSLRS
jgi:hypothetical protein